MGTVAGNICQNNRCWYYWVPDNLFDCLRKGGKACYALTGDSRYHSIFGAARVEHDRLRPRPAPTTSTSPLPGKIREGDMAGRRTHPAAAEPRAGGDRTGLPAHLRDRVRAGRVRRAGLHQRDRAVRGRPRSSTTPAEYYTAPRADDRQAGGRDRFRARGTVRGPLSAAGRSRGHRLRAHARGRRPAGLRHPALPSPPRRPAQADRRLRGQGRASSSSAPRSTRTGSRNCRRPTTPSSSPPAPGRRPRPASPASSASLSGTEFLRSADLEPKMWPARPWASSAAATRPSTWPAPCCGWAPSR